MRRYEKAVVEDLMKQTEKIEVKGVPVEIKMARDTDGAGTIDPRLLEEVKAMADRQPQGFESISEQRRHMGGINYNLNEVEIYTRYIEIETTCGKVPVWMYYPRNMEGLRPMFLYVHGGAFLGGSVFAVENGCRLLAERGNCTVCSIDYSLPPETPYPVPTTQIYEALAWLYHHALGYQMDRSRFFIGGDSAGGNMSAVVAQMDRDRKTGYLKGQALVYAKLTFTNHLLPGYQRDLGVFELTGKQKEYLKAVTGIGSEKANAGDEEVYVQGRYDITESYISPAFGKKEGLPKALMIQAEYDGLRLEGEFYASQLKEAGVPVREIRYRNVTHGFLDRIGILPQAEAAINEIAAFIQEE